MQMSLSKRSSRAFGFCFLLVLLRTCHISLGEELHDVAEPRDAASGTKAPSPARPAPKQGHSQLGGFQVISLAASSVRDPALDADG